MQNESKIRRIRSLIIVSVMSAIVLSVSTYAWFIGMQSVNVNPFEIQIKATESLMLSLDGNLWGSEINISKESLDAVSYTGHTNKWTELIPVSTVGQLDVEASRMILFEKSSETPTDGGYRIMASRVRNYYEGTGESRILSNEGNGYVAFDLFVRNYTGEDYFVSDSIPNEEAIFLTTDSEAKVRTTGADAGVAGTGIENSIRVAFTQIGRVEGTKADGEGYLPSLVTGITCNPVETEAGSGIYNPSVSGDVTGICREAKIWEPNDAKHVTGALNYYNESCKMRTGTTAVAPIKPTYNTTDCPTLSETTAYDTYAINSVINADDAVDVYDGAPYNGYTGSTKLTNFNYFTDTEKSETGTSRPEFMSLAPNSITKIRVYVYIEGQDIDNYNFSELGKKITVNFGFTKERFTPEEIGPDVDVIRPVITIDGTVGSSTITINKDEVYTEPVVTATDKVNETSEAVDVSANIVKTGTVNTAAVGTYVVYYTVTDDAGNTATSTRTVIVK